MPRAANMHQKSEFGKLICNRLSENGKNQKYLAQETGLTQVYVDQLLNGRYNPSVRTLCNISKVTGIGIEELTKALLDESQVVRILTWLKVHEVAELLELSDSAIKKAILKNKYECHDKG